MLLQRADLRDLTPYAPGKPIRNVEGVRTSREGSWSAGLYFLIVGRAAMSGALSTYLRRIWRAQLGPEAVLSEAEAAEALPGRVSEALEWIRSHVQPIGLLDGEPIYRWGDVLVALGRVASEPRRPVDRPITSWKDAAERLGVSHDTLGRRRRERDRDRRCYFEDVEALRTWWRDLIDPPESARRGPPQRARRPTTRETAIDFTALGRRLAEDPADR